VSYAAAGAWGARNGPILIRRALDREQPALFVAIAAAVLPVLAVATLIAVSIVLYNPSDVSWVGPVIVGASAGTAAGTVTIFCEVASRWWWSRRRPGRPCLGTAPSGAAATAIPRSRAALVTPLAMVIGQTAWLVIMATLSTGLWWLSAGFVLLAVPSAMRLVPVLLGRARPGGLYLTPSGLEHAWGVRTTIYPWDQVAVCATDVSFRLCGHPGSDTRSFPFDIPADATDRAPRGEPPTPMAYLALDPRSAVDLIAMYRARPHLRAHLGTSRSLEWSPTPSGAVVETTSLRQPWV